MLTFSMRNSITANTFDSHSNGARSSFNCSFVFCATWELTAFSSPAANARVNTVFSNWLPVATVWRPNEWIQNRTFDSIALWWRKFLMYARHKYYLTYLWTATWAWVNNMADLAGGLMIDKWAINFLTTHPDLENIRGTGSCRNVKLVQHQYTDNVTSYATESFGQWRLCCISLNGWNRSK